MIKRIAVLLVILLVAYASIGVAFHIGWKSAADTCRATMEAQGEFVEPEVFGGVIGLAFNVVWWPVYAWANMRLDGTPFATLCTH